MKNIQINIIGDSGSGKSCLAQLIKNTLEENEIECFILGCEDEENGEMEKSFNERLKSLKTTIIPIETIRLNREICPNN